MKIGDLVAGVNGYILASGAEHYSNAVCVSVDPLIVISKRGDMRWNRLEKKTLNRLEQLAKLIIRTLWNVLKEITNLYRDKKPDLMSGFLILTS